MVEMMVEMMVVGGALMVESWWGNGVGSQPDHLHAVNCVWGGEVGASRSLDLQPPLWAVRLPGIALCRS